MRLTLLCLAALHLLADPLPPQTGCGGGPGSPPTVQPAPLGTFSEFPVGLDGATAMTAYLYLPKELPVGRKVPLLFVLHGNGDSGKGRHANLCHVTTQADPIIVVGIQYQQGTQFNAPLWDRGLTLKAFDWLLAKVMADHPIDPDNVYLQGFSMGAGYAGMWAYTRWKDAPDAFPFRALFFVGSPAATEPSAYPPVPYFLLVGEKETAVLGRINVVEGVRSWANQLARAGRTVEYHEVPGMEHAVNGRCHQIIRDAILQLRGPRDLPGTFEEGGLAAIARRLRRGELAGAHRDLIGLAEDKAGEAKLKRAASALAKKVEDWVGQELRRLDSHIAEGLARTKTLDTEAYARLRELAEAFPKPGKRHSSALTALAKKHEAAIAARGRYLAARLLETTEPAAARAELEALAAIQPPHPPAQAAAFRLSWWKD